VWRRRVSVKGQTRLAIEFSVGDMQRAPANIAGRARARVHPLGTKNWDYRRWSIFDSSAGEMISILATREARRAISRESDASSRARARIIGVFVAKIVNRDEPSWRNFCRSLRNSRASRSGSISRTAAYCHSRLLHIISATGNHREAPGNETF